MTTLLSFLAVGGALCFVFGLKLLSKPTSARTGNAVSACGMLAATIGAVIALYHDGTLAGNVIVWLLGGLAVGASIGLVIALRVRFTSMPEVVALFNGFGGLASLLIAWSEAHRLFGNEQIPDTLGAGMLAAAVLVGGVTLTGSLVAFGKLGGMITSSQVKLSGQNVINLLLAMVAIGFLVGFVIWPGEYWLFIMVALISLVLLGPVLVLPIGGADMPVVISLLNSYSGIAVCATGFAVDQALLIVTGALVGASGFILTRVMCVAMNRSLANVLFGGYQSTSSAKKDVGDLKATIIGAPEMAIRLEASSRVLLVPGYGMAVAEAQGVVRDLADLLEGAGAEVQYAIHPVAGRMPGHMSVLLADVGVAYEKLVEMEDVNPRMEEIDTVVVIGANDTVNPDARDDAESALAGMPIIEVDRATSVLVLKRSLGSGYAGVQNPLFFKPNTSMVLGDARQTLESVVAELKDID
ncbi:MAG: NAD(P)(+) transhydrogenase (Re/Si-specific) subunit beta [Phycisphaerales bacterium JB043]